MTIKGLHTNATFAESRLSPDLASGRVAWQRTIVYDTEQSIHDVLDSCGELQAVGVQSLVVFNTESYGGNVDDIGLMTARLSNFLQTANGRVAAIEPGNELDTPGWGISDDLIIEIGRAASEVCHAFGVRCLSPSLLTGPEEGHFENIAAQLAGSVDAMAVHPYYCSVGGAPSDGWRFGTVENKADVCQNLGSGLMTWFTELGCPTGFDGIGEEGQAAWTRALLSFEHPAIEIAFQFTWTDHIVPQAEMEEGKDWGLFRLDGTPKLAAAAWGFA